MFHIPKETEELIGATLTGTSSSTPASPSTTSAQVIITSQLSTNSASPSSPTGTPSKLSSCSSPRTPPGTPPSKASLTSPSLLQSEPILETGENCDEDIKNPFND